MSTALMASSAPGTVADKALATILIIDDDPMVRTLLERQLTRLGYQVVQATNGREGLEVAAREQPDLMIVDWMMPEMDGPSVCEAIKSDPVLSQVHVIMLTANHDLDHVIARHNDVVPRAAFFNLGQHGFV